jgi:protein-L-isoaspartate(D-aspartate) O-methyltransferase
MVSSVTDDLLRRYATNVTEGVRDAAVIAAFVQVRREHFVRGVVGANGSTIPAPPDLVYSDEALVTRVCDGRPSSSSSQPSLMAGMLERLELRPGMRVLEIGAGTGYNAALLSTITGAPVVSVDVQPDVVDDARAALDRAGISGVTVRVGDGYEGAPDGAPYDRIIATVGVAGIPPAWLDQLTPDGLILAPVEHGGLQPCIAATLPHAATPPHAAAGTPSRAAPAGRAALPSGFMLAAGRLHPYAAAANAAAAEVLPVAERPPRLPFPPLDERAYRNLWFGLAALDRRVGRRQVAGFEPGHCVLVDPDEGAVLIQPDALRPIGATPALVAHAQALIGRWFALGGPPVSAWRCDFRTADELWVPANWRPESVRDEY